MSIKNYKTLAMEIIKGYNKDIIKAKTAVALGMFDGVHLGHVEIINQAIDYAKANKIKSAVITLANHPRELTQGKAPKLLTDLSMRLSIFQEMGLDYALVLEFDKKLMDMEAEDFLQKYLVETLKAKFISVGYDHHFGKNRSGTPKLLASWAKRHDCVLRVLEPYKVDGVLVSSSMIRDLISSGDIKNANRFLGCKFVIRGLVVDGDKRGQDLGFPTANLKFSDDIQLPANGVYMGSCKIYSNTAVYNKQCLVNVGTRPTFKHDCNVNVEVHILDFNENIYSKVVDVFFTEKIRDEIKFSSPAELAQQIKDDIHQANQSMSLQMQTSEKFNSCERLDYNKNVIEMGD